MREFRDIAAFCRFLDLKVMEIEEVQKRGLEKAGKVLSDEMRREIGHYQRGDEGFPDWRRLAGRTLAEKEAIGAAPPDNPLLRSGQMKESIGHTVADGKTVIAGSTDIVAVYQEKGTEGPNPGADGFHVPARSFIARAAYRKGADAVKLIGRELVFALTGVRVK